MCPVTNPFQVYIKVIVQLHLNVCKHMTLIHTQWNRIINPSTHTYIHTHTYSASSLKSGFFSFLVKVANSAIISQVCVIES